MTVEARIEDGVARISVTDTGIGIKPDDLPRLGDPFFQVKSGYDRSFEGAGLGLSLVRGSSACTTARCCWNRPSASARASPLLLPLAIRPAPRRVVAARLDTIPD